MSINRVSGRVQGFREGQVAIFDDRPLDAALVNGQLTSQSDILQSQLRAILDCELEQVDKKAEISDKKAEIRHPADHPRTP